MRLSRNKGTTLLFLSGAMAVVTILTVSMGMVTTRGFLDAHRARQRAQAEWIARAAMVYATRHADQLTSPGAQIEKEMGAGAFVVRLDATTTSTRAFVCEARVPAKRPAVTLTRRTALP